MREKCKLFQKLCNTLPGRLAHLCTLTITNFNKLEIMGNLLYVIAVVLLILWAIGFVGYNAGGLIHVLLVIAIIAVLLRLIQGRKIF